MLREAGEVGRGCVLSRELSTETASLAWHQTWLSGLLVSSGNVGKLGPWQDGAWWPEGPQVLRDVPLLKPTAQASLGGPSRKSPPSLDLGIC